MVLWFFNQTMFTMHYQSTSRKHSFVTSFPGINESIVCCSSRRRRRLCWCIKKSGKARITLLLRIFLTRSSPCWKKGLLLVARMLVEDCCHPLWSVLCFFLRNPQLEKQNPTIRETYRNISCPLPCRHFVVVPSRCSCVCFHSQDQFLYLVAHFSHQSASTDLYCTDTTTQCRLM